VWPGACVHPLVGVLFFPAKTKSPPYPCSCACALPERPACMHVWVSFMPTRTHVLLAFRPIPMLQWQNQKKKTLFNAFCQGTTFKFDKKVDELLKNFQKKL